MLKMTVIGTVSLVFLAVGSLSLFIFFKRLKNGVQRKLHIWLMRNNLGGSLNELASKIVCDGCGQETNSPLPKEWRLFMPRGTNHSENRKVYVCPKCMES
jgi:hypothetical protein